MKMPSPFTLLTIFSLVSFSIIILPANTDAYSLPERLVRSTAELRNHTAISEFRVVNRRQLINCPDPNPYLGVSASSNASLSDDGYITVNITGVLVPSRNHWVAMISPSHSNKKECKMVAGKCVVKTCAAALTFHVVNIRTDIEFVMFSGGFNTPCILRRSDPVSFANPNRPLYAHLSSVDSTATSMRLTWVSGDKIPQQVKYGSDGIANSSVSTFSQADMCAGSGRLGCPAADFGWHDPGYIHSALITGLHPSSSYTYKYGSNSVGWSNVITLKTPAAGGSDELRFLAYGDMGKAPLDSSVEHYIQPGSVSVTKAMAEEVSSGSVDSIFHIGDISYATGFLVEWDFFLHLINPLASRVSYMTAIGNHERDYGGSGSVYITPDSGGECGVPYETYFPMPTPAKDKPWYSIDQGPVHFTVISTEHTFSPDSEQYEWMSKDMAAVNRTRTPWLIFTGHRPMYTSSPGIPILPNVDRQFVDSVEPLLLASKEKCKGMPKKDGNGVDTYDNSNYTAPVHAIIGMAGFKLDDFTQDDNSWSLVRILEFGYIRAHATKHDLHVEFVNAVSRKVDESFRIIKR
ncbi:hypothetical protein C2S52_017087 [Perilla frutescens var. hirtella]|nr:hypothetical protein C2S52_017087 [Perilla frutescens var. hirtella]KAH6810887.1 hypothetical protein C2S51_024649 [Perilla frutescens var. frutescens]